MTEQLEKLRPTLILLGVLIVSAILGYAWGSSGVRIADTGPWQMHTSYQGIYVQTVADAYALDGNDSLAVERLSFLCQENDGIPRAFDEAGQRYSADPVKAANLDQLRTLVVSGQVVQNTGVEVCKYRPVGQWISIARIIAPLLLVLGALGIGALGVMRNMRAEEEEDFEEAAALSTARLAPAPATAEETVPAAEPVEAAPRRATLPGFGRRPKEEPQSAASMGAQISKTVEKTDFEELGQDPPIVQFMTTYLHGDDLYDDSFSIETPSGEFLGETGVGVSETLGAAGDSQSVTALEVWLFDKNDIRTVTKVLMSDHAFNDDAIRAKLAPKGEAVLVRSGDKIMLQTATLRVQARIVDLAYNSNAMPPNSVIDRITIELAAWKRDGQPGRPGAGGSRPGAPIGGGTPPTGLPPLPSDEFPD